MRYVADPPIAFRIERTLGSLVLAPLVVDASRELSTRFTARSRGRHCLVWEAGGEWPTLLRFRLTLLPG